MKIIAYIFTYNRKIILQKCLETVLKENCSKFTEINIIDDCSEKDIKYSLLDFSIRNSNTLPINIYLKNRRIGHLDSFKLAYNSLKAKNTDIVFFVESDYIFRSNYLDDVINIFNANPYCLAIPATSHPDYHSDSQIKDLFPRVMREHLGEDIPERDLYFKSFYQEINNKTYKLQGVTNSCGCFFLNYKLLKTIFNDEVFGNEFENKLDSSMESIINGVPMLNDGNFTSTLTYYWSKWAYELGLDMTKNFAWLDMCSNSIGTHKCFGGINGMFPGLKEGDSFVDSPVWIGED